MPMEKNFDAARAEHEIARKWDEADAFAAGANAKDGADPFCIMIPPPNVTGSLHMGHAFNNTLQDILVRWHRMRGFDTLWQPGQDHAGIATQMVVERKLAADGAPTRRELGRDAFLEKVWDWKAESGDTIINQLKRLGASCDWSRNAFTMSGNFPDAVIKVFVEMYNKGLIYRGKRLVNWDPHFETAISDLEVENIEVDGHMWHFKYPLAGGETYEYVEKDEDGNVTLRETRDYISIATTRPETMLGDGAVAVHPSDDRYAPIVGKLCEIPVGPKEHRRLIPIITDSYPDPDFGSGAVKITGAHDFNDYEVAKRGNIPMYRLMDTKGRMRDDGRAYAEEAAIAQNIANGDDSFGEASIAAMNLVPEEYRGLDRFEARKRVVADITAEGLAVMVANPDRDDEGAPAQIPYVEAKKIMQPFGDRSKVVIEPMLTDQWFVDTDKIVGPALEAVRTGETQILPEQDKKVYFNWLENIEPWCISRQLWWGHQIPVWYGPDPDSEGGDSGHSKPFCAPTWSDASALAQEYYSARLDGEVRVRQATNKDMAFFEAGEADHLADETASYPTSTGVFRNLDSGSFDIHLYRDPDVLDTWFSSGLWPIGTLGWPEQTEELKKYFPTNVLVTGFDIIFFWVARMMMMQTAVLDQSLPLAERVPFKTVYVHALVRDEKGKKMSKSLGNVLDPLELIDQYGADAVRFTLTAMAAMGRDLKLSTSRIEGYRNFGTKLWNAARFAEMYECFDHAGTGIPAAEQTVNRWIIGETARVREAVDEALTAYRFNDAAGTLYSYVWGTVCDWYVELSKPLLQGDDGAAKRETQTALAWVLDQCLILLHPIMPFITEQLWSDLASRQKLLVHGDWPTYTAADLAVAEADAEMRWIIGLIEAIRSVRAEMNVGAAAKIPLILTGVEGDVPARVAQNEALLLRLARLEGITFADAVPTGAVTLPITGAIACLPLAGIIDVAAEKARLGKALQKVEKEIAGLNAKLLNEKFLAKAPQDVVADQRNRLSDAAEEADKLRQAVQRIEAMAG